MTDLLAAVIKACTEHRIYTHNRQTRAIEYLFAGKKIIDVAVLGQFKAGKSSFLNAFMGRDILPTGIIPLTAVITRIAHGDRDEAVISYFDGLEEEIDPVNIAEYVSESKNPANKKHV
jgi:predicted GTPase